MLLLFMSGCLLLAPPPDAVSRILEPGAATNVAAVGSAGACATFENGTIRCTRDVSDLPNDADFKRIDADAGACAIDSEYKIRCFGGFASGPAGEYDKVAMGAETACALGRRDGELTCWGSAANGRREYPTAAGFVDVAVGETAVCALLGSSLECWGDETETIVSESLGGSYSALAVAGTTVCALRDTTGSIRCFGGEGDGRNIPPDGEFAAITGGSDHFCALSESGEISCWGSDDEGQSSPPSGTFVKVDAGRQSACAIDESGSITCWGESEGSDPAASH